MAKKASDIMKDKAKSAGGALKAVFNASVCQKLAHEVATQIKKRTRLGYGVRRGGQQKPLAVLSDPYVEFRRKHKSELFEDTQPKRSNLTATGQLLNAITGKGSTARIEISLTPDGRSKGLGGVKPKDLTNSKLLGYVEKLRRFFALTNPEKNRFVREVKLILKTGIKNAIAK